ncbi:D-2-hydroxyacid dehydrogenase [Alloalcanivorax xenomutans]|jgi:glycerate dehydrogenase|uniref:D-2-hydroxyacid dehydrogenase n=1 Tax=Alloalcanivorax xenomutans TaxID=1094342 RepID=UPI0003B81BDA|nr:D-2-hydroxyacid dehydrogenase [Alloalcanivorax xenomutans]ERS13911.1 glycerate dehydrogenase [Alcanivorax sp. PN-3]MBA4721803.1 D-2-hydroxyacid dehydrogenase [Alcanivorax sp.]PHS72500.1 MAG: glycerate dehydrogenase [Alcanivorax sp.]CUR48005.1 Glycerate dehydrogenase [Alloalcanivorax xenomutans]SOB95696.1 glycerate dehydrogenase [Alloalcanivorax xenomutans]|tara:strand:- start:1339 stop:2307 length:969 start_codon:yes stop_codon:yes gene_type:complete
MQGVFLDIETIKPSELDLSALRAALSGWTFHDRTAPEQVAERLAGAAVAVTNKVVIDRATMDACPDLKFIGISATGTNNVDLGAAREKGIVVSNVVGYSTATVAQHAVALMLGLATQWHRYDRDAQQGRWSESTMFCRMDYPVVDLAGRTLGIIGYGALGRQVAAIARAMGMDVLVAASLRPGAGPAPDRVPLPEFLRRADVISLHCPLTEDTQGLVNDDFLAAMRPGAFLINTARGPLVDEAALERSLRAGHLGGAALDVLSQEPPPADHPLLGGDVPNLIVTPHSAWVSTECRQRMVDQVVENIHAWRNGQPVNVVNQGG